MRLNTVLALFAAASLCLASASFTGYSGAPGTTGTCAGFCHGSTGGTITVGGFPTSYTPGQAYVITVAHNGGSSIDNFNASVRAGSGPTNAGAITAGTNTAVYSVSGETNGVHFTTAGQASGTFTWTAPDPGVGQVKLYLAGHQGATTGGPNTVTVLTSDGAGVAETEGRRVPASFRLEQTVVSSHLVLRIDNPRSAARVRILDRGGRVVARLAVSAGANQTIAWPLLDGRGRRLTAGAYYVTFSASGASRVAKFTVTSR
ncbi:hypothetical protein FJY68_09530 [candidate division WOR-3 bacterium]|uniref:FlgD Ig-like domain-containing protein n=1 Tax=candidate division WOR-3 bacterium TaxID=2052148 RepID=A0A937XET0_UNCW3|nr:hypothetical protein [candidate division WOR-3 bacterium]